MTSSKASRWYREPMMWLAIGLPLSAVVAGFVTLAIALDAPAAALAEPTQRVGVGQTSDLSADLNAARRQLSATLSIDGDTGAVRCVVNADSAEDLTLLLVHGTDAAQDLRIRLVRSGPSEYLGRTPTSAFGLRELQLSAPAAGWRLVGQLSAGTRTAQLRPALAVSSG